MSGRRRVARALLGLSLAAGGCYDGFDPMDPEVLAQIARSRGDAEGLALSGLYIGEAEALECGCDEVEASELVSLCALVEQLDAASDQPSLPLTVVQADGTVQVLLQPPSLDLDEPDPLISTLYGPLDADGRVSAAGVLQGDGLVAQGQVLARLDGTLARAEGPPMLEVEYQQRTVVRIIEGASGLDVGGGEVDTRDVDCRERVGLEMTWVDVLPEPIEP